MIAQPMRCVNDTLPPRERRRWLLITMRLSIMSFAGMVRTLVAVGTERLWSMFAASVFGRPLRATISSSRSDSTTGCGLVIGTSAGTGWVRGATEVVRASGAWPMTGWGAVAGAGSAAGAAGGAGIAAGASGAAGAAGAASTGAAGGVGGAAAGSAGAAGAVGAAGAPDAGASGAGAVSAAVVCTWR